MAVAKLVALSVVLVAATGLSPHVTAAGGKANLLQHWLEDSAARHDLLNTWVSEGTPLASAFTALNNSTPTFSSVDERLSIISVECAIDVYKLLNTRSLWALSMIDASVKIPVGLLKGVLTHLGNWDECVDQRDIPSNYMSRTFNGQMCMLSLRPQLETATGVGESQSVALAHPSPVTTPELSAMLSYMQISMGVCLPDSCSASDVQTLFEKLLGNLKIVDGIKLVPTVSDGACTTRDAPGLDSGDMVAVMVLSILAALVVMSTVYDVVTPAEERRALPAAFSVISNGRKLLALPRQDADHTLSCLHGMRFLSMCWVVLCHSYQTYSTAVNTNPRILMEIARDFWHLFLSNGTLSVDTFFVLSGLLLTYLFFKQDKSKHRLNIPLYYIHRYIRLTPALAMMALLTTTLLQHASWGPLWNSTMSGGKEVCQQNWWNTLLYVGNYVRPLQQCVPQSWYLMVDMQLHWLSPLVLLPLVYAPKIGLAWLLILCVGGTLSNFLICYLQEFPGSPFEVLNNPELIAYSQKNFYFPTHTRFVPYLIGMGVGYILAIRSKRSDQKPFSFIISCLGWLIVAGLMLGSLLAYNMFLNPPYPNILEASVYSSLERPAWALGVALAVYLCAIGNGGGANEFLSWWGFHILGRLTYSMYLVHLIIMTIQVGALKYILQVGDAEIFIHFCGDLVMALMFAAVLSLVCESPFLVLEKELFGRGRKTKSVRSPVDETSNTLTLNTRSTPSAIDNIPSSIVSVEPSNSIPKEDTQENTDSALIESRTDVTSEILSEISESSTSTSVAQQKADDIV